MDKIKSEQTDRRKQEKNVAVPSQEKMLKVKANLLIEQVEASQEEIRKKQEEIKQRDLELASLQKELEQTKDAIKKQSQAQDRTEKKRIWKEKVNHFFNHVESLLYRFWMAAWVCVIGVLLTLAVTIMLNAELRESVLYFLRNSILGG